MNGSFYQHRKTEDIIETELNEQKCLLNNQMLSVIKSQILSGILYTRWATQTVVLDSARIALNFKLLYSPQFLLMDATFIQCISIIYCATSTSIQVNPTISNKA